MAFVYDVLNRAVETRQSFAGKTYTISYAYDAVGNRTMMATPWGKYSYTYDVLNRVDSLTNPQGIVVSFKYDAAGRRIGKTVFAAARNTAPLAETAYSYDAAGQLLSIANKAGGKVVAFDSYTYDALGNRVRIEDQNGVKDYTYDKSSRLIVVKPVPFNMANAEAFVYDRNGNRRYDREAKDYKYDAANRLLENTVYTYTHDQLGNLTSRTEKASSATITYAYNPEQQLSNVITPDAKVEYKYDPLGRRTEKTVNAAVARFLYDGQNIIADLDGTGQQVNTYTNGPGIDEPLIMAKPDGKSYHYHADALGSITAITDNAGATIETYQYKAYGIPTIKNSTGAIIAASLIDNTRMFTAREYEPKTGFYNNRRRYQDPDRGAFTQEDPILLEGGLNFYVYAQNNPLKYIDPMGLKTVVVIASPPGLNPGHAGLYIERDGKITIYDPQGSFDPGFGVGGSRVIEGGYDLLKKYQAYQQGESGDRVEAFAFDTTPEEEGGILDEAMELGGGSAYGFACADYTSAALSAASRFKDIPVFFRPSKLAKWLRRMQIRGLK